MRDLYEVLGVSKTASAQEIKKAWHRLAKQYHPDANPDAGTAEKFKEAANAFQILSDDQQRATYDRYGMDGLRGSSGGPPGGFSSVEDVFSAFGDLFGDFFGGGRGQRAPRGADVRVEMELSFADAVWGTTRDVSVRRNVACEGCKGSGAKAGTTPEMCGTCGGKGQVVHAQGFFMVQTACPRCRGEGRIIKEACGTCGGRRVTPETSTLEVSIPAGIDHGQTLRVPGKGEAGPGGAGHLYVTVAVEENEHFVRDGFDVLTEVPISFVKAAMGGEVVVPTLDDRCQGETTIAVKPGTQPGAEVVRKGQGVPEVGSQKRGDHVVRFVVDIPTKLSSRAEDLMRQLGEELGEPVKGKRGLFGRRK